MAETEWVLVPREPTAEMRTAALETAAKYNRGHSEDHIKALALDSQSIYRAMLSASPKPPHQEEGAAGLAERLSDWRARGVSGEDADAAASALLSQASQIEALRKERDEADNALVDKYRNPKTGHFSFPGDVAAIVRRLEATETKLAEAVEQAFRDGLAYGTNVRNADPDLAWDHSRAKAFLDANGGGHEAE